jgi:hypothetical protein
LPVARAAVLFLQVRVLILSHGFLQQQTESPSRLPPQHLTQLVAPIRSQDAQAQTFQLLL